MQVTDLNIINEEYEINQIPELGSGGIENSFANSEGEIFLNRIEVDRAFTFELKYEIFDNNGEKDAFNDPVLLFDGFSFVTKIDDKFYIIIEESIEGVADPTTGSLSFKLQFTNAQEDLGVALITDINISNDQRPEEQPTDDTINVNDYQPQTSIDSCGNVTVAPSICAPQPNSNCAGVGGSVIAPGAGCDPQITVTPTESTAVTEEEYIDVVEAIQSTNTTEDEYIGIEIVTEVQEETATQQPFAVVSTEEQLKNALGNANSINIVSDITINEFLYVPGNTTIRGINNPTITVNAGAAFNIREDNITLTGFTLTSSNQVKAYGIQIGRKDSRDNPIAPKNITIDSVTFDNIGGNGDKQAAINVSGYQLVYSLTIPTKEVPGLLEGSELIKNVVITNNVFKNIPNNAIDIWNVEDVTIQSNIFENTRGFTSAMGNAVRGNSLLNARVVSNTLTNIGRTGIEITGNGSKNILIEDNLIDRFGTQENLDKQFTTGISVVQGANNITIKDNTITGSGKGGGVNVAQNSSNFLIENNNISNVNKGIAISAHADKFNVTNNTIQYLLYGIQTFQVWSGVIQNNVLIQSENVIQANPAITVEQSNGIVVQSNEIRGDFLLENNEKAIWVYGKYPSVVTDSILYAGNSNLLKITMLNYSVGIPNIYDKVYNPAVTKATDVITNTFLFNILNGEGRLFQQQSANVFLPGGVAGRGGTSNDIQTNTNSVIEVIETKFDKTVKEDDNKNTDLDEVIKDNEESSVTNINNSTATFTENDNDNTITFTTLNGTEQYDKDALDVKEVDTNVETGYKEEENIEEVTSTERVEVLPNINDFSTFIEISNGVTPEREFEIITNVEGIDEIIQQPLTPTSNDEEDDQTIIINDPFINLRENKEQKIIPGTQVEERDDEDPTEFTRIIDPQDPLPPDTKIDDPGDDNIPPGTPVDTPTVFPPVILLPPPEIPPFIPADCGNPPVPRINVPVGEDPDIVTTIVETPTTPVVEQEPLIYPAPVLSLTPPFLSNINFDTNITKKEPTPYSFDIESEVDPEVTSESSSLAQEAKQNLCNDEEDCNKLGF